MAPEPERISSVQKAREAPLEAIPTLLASANEDILRVLIENPALDETHMCLLLERKDLSGNLLDAIAKNKSWRGNYRVRRALAGHPHTPRLAAMRLLRELHLMDLVRITLQPTSPAELRRLADERIIAQLPQLPLGQRIMLARRASGRVAGGLIVLGPENVARIALDNSFLTESQLLRSLAQEGIAERTLAHIAKHQKWSKVINVRIALLRHPRAAGDATLNAILCFLPELPQRELEELAKLSRVQEIVRTHLCRELARRKEQQKITGIET